MNVKKLAAALLTVSTAMSTVMPLSVFADGVKIITDDAVIKNAGTVKVMEEEVELVVKGQVDKIIVTEDGEETEITIRKGASVKEILVEGEDTEIQICKGASVENIVFNGDEGEAEGRGHVGTVQANGDECEIDVPGAKVIVGENAEETEAGDVELKPGDVVVINPNGEGVTPVEPEKPEPEKPVEPQEGHEVVLTVLNGDQLTKGQAITIRCNGVHENGKCDFMQNISSVVITAPNGKTDNVMADGAESVFDEIGYTVDSMTNTLTIGKDTLNQAFAHDENGVFAAGEYKIALTAENYSEKTVSVNVADKEAEPEKPQTTLAAPEVADVVKTGNIMGSYHKVSFKAFDGIKAYLEAVEEITLNGTAAKKVTNLQNETKAYKLGVTDDSQSVYNYDHLQFTLDSFEGKVEVVVKAKGYENLTFTVMDGKLVLPVLTAPEVADVVKAGNIMGSYHKVSFKAFDGIKAYLDAVEEITLNGTAAKKVTNLQNETKAYKLGVTDDSQSVYNYDHLQFTLDSFTGKVEVVVKAKGYEDLTFTVVDGKLMGSLMTAPKAAAVTPVGGVFGKTHKVSFEAFEGITDYLNAVTNVTLNGTPAKKVTNLFGETKAYKLAVMDGSQSVFDYDCLEFTADCFGAEPVAVVVSAEGYEDMTFTVVNGKLA